ncbi:FAD-binding domain-containing protein, partial [Choiromyces venosus 120613-1]
AKEVSTAVKLISSLETPFSVRSGGHSANHGFANTDCGILISLNELTEVSLSAGKSVASIGPGNWWGTEYEALAPHGAGVVGGRIHTVGVAKLILGGGLFDFTNGLGFACDNVKNIQPVPSTCEIVNANADENRDLFWGLKGGSGNFDIITRFDLATFPKLGNFQYEVLRYSGAHNEILVEALEEYQ